MRSDTGSGKVRDEMERREIVHNAYAVVGQLSKGYDGMMKAGPIGTYIPRHPGAL